MALRISDLGTAPTVEDTDLVEIAEVDGESPSGYSSYKTTILGIANKIATSTVFSGLVTTAKNIVGAINEIVNGFDNNVIDVIKDLKQVRSATITDGIATFDDVLEANPLVEATATFSPKQSGTGDPSPTNIRPISGWDSVDVVSGGKNQVIYVLKKALVTSGGVMEFANQYDMCIAYVESGKKYTITTNEQYCVYAFFTDKPQLGSTSYNQSRTIEYNFTFTAPITGFCAFRCLTGFEGWQLEEGETATERQAPIVYPATFDSTIYGGIYDFVSGDGSVNRIIVDVADVITTYDTSSSRFASGIISNIVKPPNNSTVGNIISTIYRPERVNQQTSYGDYTVGISSDGRIWIYDKDYTNLTQYKEAIRGQKICYELATPTPIELTGQEIEALEGVNVVTTDGDGMSSVKYKKMN